MVDESTSGSGGANTGGSGEPGGSIVGDIPFYSGRNSDTGSEHAGGNASDDPAIDTGQRIDGIRVAQPAGGNAPTGNTAGNDADESAPYGRRADGSPRAKPGRKASGSGTARTASPRASGPSKKNSTGIKGLEKLLFSMHAMVAIKTKAPELIIDAKEAELLAQAISDVQDHYGFEVSPETAVWVNLVTALGSVYGPRAISIYSRVKKEKAASERKEKPQTTVDLNANSVASSFLDIPGLHIPA